jgi:type I restriction enzyme M protein
VDHDLFNHDGKTEDGIAEAFIEFAKKEGLSFFDLSLSINGFDDNKYQVLMDRLEATEVKLSETSINKDFRIDSEFHKQAPIQNSNYQYVEIGKILTFVQYGLSIDMNEDNQGTKIYRMNEIHNMLCDTQISKCAEISQEDINNYKLFENDILFNRTNSFDFVGRTGIFKEFCLQNYVFASYLIRVRTDTNKVLPEYLVTFLNTRLGIWDIKRRARISINQSNVNAQELSAIKIPLLSINFQSKLKILFNIAHKNRLDAQTIYQQAEELLLSELGLKDWQPTEDNITQKSFSASFLASGRLDAEYYQPKYDHLDNILGKSNFFRLKDISTNICTGFPYESSNFVEEGVDLIRINNITKDGLDLSNAVKISIQDSLLRPKNKVKYGDILISMSGTIGLSCSVQENINAFINQRIMRIEPINFNSDLLSFIINSIIVKMQLERVGTGGVQTNLSNDDILNIKIPIISINNQKQIITKLAESKNLKQQSKQLLEIAKIGVERAIENDEETGILWIDEELGRLGIEI